MENSTEQSNPQQDLDLEKQRQQEIDGHICGAIEALLFVCEKPVSIEQLKNALETVGSSQIKKAIEAIQEKYDEASSGLTILELAGGYQMLSNATYATYIRNFYKTRKKEKLSRPALECMAIIAYKQPVTRSDVELVRGVNSDGVVAHLLNKELIKIAGRKEVPGRPYLYGTTKKFLEYFGLKSLDYLPNLEEFTSLQPKDEVEASAVDESVVEKNVDEVVAEIQENGVGDVAAVVSGESVDTVEESISEIEEGSIEEPAENLDDNVGDELRSEKQSEEDSLEPKEIKNES